MALLYLVFFASGFPALIYQLMWQRSLFTIYGVNIESITVVVAAFMLGLGLGSLAGGQLSRLRWLPPLVAFGIIELGIGLFGLVSLDLFAVVAEATLGAGPFQTFLYSFMLVVLPTLLMGATLPILVAFLVRQSGNVGRSVGMLYFVNTLGSAAACLVGAIVLFGALGKAGSVQVAVAINLAIGIGAIGFHLWRGRQLRPDVEATAAPAAAAPANRGVSFLGAMLLVGLIGFIALSYEILWARVFMVAVGGRALAFALLLGFFLGGLAVGAYVSRQFCASRQPGDPRHLRAVGGFVLFANLFGFLVAPLMGGIASAGINPVIGLLGVMVAAGSLGAVLPLVSHFGVAPDHRAGTGLSYLYLANIIGSVAGSLLTGFLLMDWLPLKVISVLLALLGVIAGGAVLWVAGPGERRLRQAGVAAATGVVILLVAGPAYDRVYGRLLLKGAFGEDVRISQVLETRSGVITVTDGGHVYGGGVYDGVLNVDLMHDRNYIVRPFAVAALHPQPREVLMIGLGSGSWAQVMAHHPDLERMVIVEINKGYYDLIASHDVVRSLTENPKVEFVVDDGRRWLARNAARFDFILANTTMHWASFATNLLSVEFLELIRPHLKEGGIYMFNSTWSPSAQRTATMHYPYAYRFLNMVAVSDQPIDLQPERLRGALKKWHIDGQPVLDLNDPAQRARFEKVIAQVADRRPFSYAARWSTGIESRDSILERTAGLPLITDDNMLEEWPRERQRGGAVSE